MLKSVNYVVYVDITYGVIATFAAVSFCSGGKAFYKAQKFKKTVSTIITLVPRTDSIPGPCSDTTLAEMIVNELQAGRIFAYQTDDIHLLHKLTFQQLFPKPGCSLDSITIIDPTCNKEYSYANHSAPDFSLFKKYRIIEEWYFDAVNGLTKIEITGIIPMLDIYNGENHFLGSRGVFIVKYHDIEYILSQYEKYRPDCVIAELVWDNYFSKDDINEDHW